MHTFFIFAHLLGCYIDFILAYSRTSYNIQISDIFNFCGGECDDLIHVVGLEPCIVCSTVALDLAASATSVDQNVSLLRIGNGFDGIENAEAGILPVAREIVNMDRAQAKRAVVTRGGTERFYCGAAVLANKPAVVFCKSFTFHEKTPCMVGAISGKTVIDYKMKGSYL